LKLGGESREEENTTLRDKARDTKPGGGKQKKGSYILKKIYERGTVGVY